MSDEERRQQEEEEDWILPIKRLGQVVDERIGYDWRYGVESEIRVKGVADEYDLLNMAQGLVDQLIQSGDVEMLVGWGEAVAEWQKIRNMSEAKRDKQAVGEVLFRLRGYVQTMFEVWDKEGYEVVVDAASINPNFGAIRKEGGELEVEGLGRFRVDSVKEEGVRVSLENPVSMEDKDSGGKVYLHGSSFVLVKEGAEGEYEVSNFWMNRVESVVKNSMHDFLAWRLRQRFELKKEDLHLSQGEMDQGLASGSEAVDMLMDGVVASFGQENI